jgi:hypothetical protein
MRYLIAPPRASTFFAHSASTDPVVELMVPGLGHLDVLAIAVLINTNHCFCAFLSIALANSMTNLYSE